MNINRINPSTLKITDMRFADIDGAPKRCTLVKLCTNQGLVGYGEVRDASSRT
jgi:L-alanine-DL-glutamate epimerase-like enolase superfamily enzyme